MKKEYQNKRAAAEELRAAKEVSGDAIQLAFPTAEMLQLLEKGVGELIRQVGKLFIASVLEVEVEQMVGRRSKRQQERKAYRWGSGRGYCVVDGQRVPISQPRIRGCNGRELPLSSYQLFQQASPAEETVWSNIMRGLSMRNYKEVLQQFLDAYGLKKSTISERFIEVSRKKLELLLTRSLAHLQLCAILMDGTIFKGQHLVVAIGIDRLGHKIVLGLVQGATENATVVSGLLDQLSERGVDFSVPRLYLLDGSKALRSAIRRHAGEAAFVQRCQVHKIRNVTDYLPEEQRAAVKFRMRAAYSMPEASDAKQALYRLHSELTETNPSAADSLAEGLEETLTVQELGVHARLRRSLASTNGIESSFSVVETICRQVKRWQGSDHRLRWIASAMLYVETRWNRLHGYRHLPLLVHNLERAFQLRLAFTGNSETAASAA